MFVQSFQGTANYINIFSFLSAMASANPQIIQDLGLNSDNISEFEEKIISWCNEKFETDEYNNRIIAAKSIIKCYTLNETVLELQNLSLTTLPDLNLPNLQQLYLEGNRLAALPALNLPNLQGLYLEGNQLTALPEGLSLPNLQWLDLEGNQITALPEGLSLANLQGLYLRGNQLTALPEVLSLPNLLQLNLEGNQLTALPERLSLPNLLQLVLEGNQPLTELPLSLADSNLLAYIDIDGTQIQQALADQILAACQRRRNAAALQKLPELLSLWSGYAGKEEAQLQVIRDFEERDQQEIHEWLTRLSRTRDFRGNQQALAKIVCEMLADLTHAPFKELFINQISVNNEACQDRAAMALNEIYVSWKILVPKEEMSDQDRLALLAGAGKTLALRKILSAMPQMADQNEGVEIYLYYETSLRERLGLCTAIQTMSYGHIGKRDWVDENLLAQQIEKQFLNEAIEIPMFEELFSKDQSAMDECAAIQEQFGNQLEQLTERLEQNELNEAEYKQACDQCMIKQKQACDEFKQSWLLSRLEA